MKQKTNTKSKPLPWKAKVFIILSLVIGFGLMAYPFISNYLFEHRQDSLIETYQAEADTVDVNEEQLEMERAKQYNSTIFTEHVQLQDPFKEEKKVIDIEKYQSLLNINGDGLMGYISIPCINVNMPIYHGTDGNTLENGIGHLEGTSLPIGGETTHTVLTGHTGLNKAKIFTDLTQMNEGDSFYIYVLKEKLAYQVDQILVVEPQNTDDLTVVEGMDYCTLITCTPYGINSHRLLVRGHRIPYVEEQVVQEEQYTEDRGESLWMRQYKRALLIGFIVIILITIIGCLTDDMKYRRNIKNETHNTIE